MSANDDKPTRKGVLAIPPWLLHRALLLPKDVRIDAIHYDIHTDSLLLRLEGETMPLAYPGTQLIRLTALYSERAAGPDDRIVELKELA